MKRTAKAEATETPSDLAPLFRATSGAKVFSAASSATNTAAVVTANVAPHNENREQPAAVSIQSVSNATDALPLNNNQVAVNEASVVQPVLVGKDVALDVEKISAGSSNVAASDTRLTAETIGSKTAVIADNTEAVSEKSAAEAFMEVSSANVAAASAEPAALAVEPSTAQTPAAQIAADSAMPTQPQLAAYWKLDAGTGTIAADSSGKGSTGTINGATWVNVDGGNLLDFDGISNQVNFTASNELWNVADNFTMSFWVKPRSTHEIDPEGSLAAHYGTSGQRYVLGPNQPGDPSAGAGISVGTNGVSVYEHAANYMPATLVHQTTIDRWTHVAVVYENRQPKLYLNGTLAKTGVTSTRSRVTVSPTSIGGMTYGYFDGQLADVRIYKGAMNAAQVAATAVVPAKLLAHWKFDEAVGGIAQDSSGQENEGTLIGATRTQGKIGTGALNFDGVNDSVFLEPVPFPNDKALADVTNNFTISFWAKPRAAHEIDAESASGYGGVSGQKYAIGAMHGTVFQGDSTGMGPDHAGAGVSVGTNGISVYEHTGNYMPATLVYPATISDWTHITVVYQNRQP
ncbi:MAG TPA: LamG-like jellyroll fold domain-containing protein, partial [Pyrinomonadaceae bacterium]